LVGIVSVEAPEHSGQVMVEVSLVTVRMGPRWLSLSKFIVIPAKAGISLPFQSRRAIRRPQRWIEIPACAGM